jgi:peroxiredoxin Q/BCP
MDAVILGVSPDTVLKQAKFKKKYHLPFTLLADVDHAIAEAYGAWKLKKTMGKSHYGVERSTAIIDPEGRVAGTFEKVSALGHAEHVAQALEELRSR